MRTRTVVALVLPTSAQVGSVMGAADAPHRAFLALAAFAGLRLGEAAGLQVGDIDFLRRTLTVRRQVQRAGAGAVEVRAPKYGSERVVYLADGLLELLSEHIGRHCPGERSPRWVFETTAGLPPHQNTVGHQWRKARERAQVTDVTLHDLRHFYASGLIAAGCDVVTVQRPGTRQGHHDVAHLCAPVADGGGPHALGRQRAVRCRHGWSCDGRTTAQRVATSR